MKLQGSKLHRAHPGMGWDFKTKDRVFRKFDLIQFSIERGIQQSARVFDGNAFTPAPIENFAFELDDHWHSIRNTQRYAAASAQV